MLLLFKYVMEKEILLKKLGIADERSITSLITNKELVYRILNEEVICISDAIKTYEISAKKIESLISGGFISTFYNSKNNGSKKFVFKNELISFLPYVYKKSRFTYDCLEFNLKLFNIIGEKMLSVRELEIFNLFMKGNNVDYISDKFNLTNSRVFEINKKAQIRMLNANRKMKSYESIISEYNIINSNYEELKNNLKTLKIKNKKELSEKIHFLDFNEKYKNIPCSDLDLSLRASNCLKAAEIESIYDLINLTEKEIYKFRNTGKKSVYEIIKCLAELGLSLKK